MSQNIPERIYIRPRVAALLSKQEHAEEAEYIHAEAVAKEREELVDALKWAMDRVRIIPCSPERDYYQEDREKRAEEVLKKHTTEGGAK